MAELDQARGLVDALTRSLLTEIDSVWEQISRAEQLLIADWLTLNAAQRRRRVTEMQQLASRLMDRIDAQARGEIADVLRSAYQAGAIRSATIVGAPADVTGIDADLIESISDDTWLDVLNATKHVRQTTKEMVRDLGQQAADLRFSGLTTAEAAAKQLAQAMAQKGISAIVYRDGSRHGLDDYSNMLLRTKTAEIQQVGGFSQAKRLGVRFMELMDNPSCGLSFHDDPTLANGLILPVSEAEKYPISHPRCVRVSAARPDILTPQDARDATPSTTAEQNADQRGVEQTRQSAAANRAARRLESRTARSSTGLLTPSAGAAESPAARRAVTRMRRAETRAAQRSGVPDEFRLGDTDTKALHGRDAHGRWQYDQDRLQAYHDPYVNSRLEAATTVDEPEFRVMGGGAASGKSSILKSGDVQLPEGHVLVNADEAKEVLPEYRAGVKAGSQHAAAFVHEESSDMAKRLTSESLQGGHHTVLDGVGNGSVDSLAGKIARAREDGATRVVGDYVTVDTDEAIRRAIKRAQGSGRYVPIDVIRHGHETVSNTFRQAVERGGLFDELRLWDNNGSSPRLIYSQIHGVETIHDPVAFESFLRKSPNYPG